MGYMSLSICEAMKVIMDGLNRRTVVWICEATEKKEIK